MKFHLLLILYFCSTVEVKNPETCSIFKYTFPDYMANVIFFCWNRENMFNPEEFNADSDSVEINNYFPNTSEPILLIFHGYISNCKDSWVFTLKDAFYQYTNKNYICCVDWSIDALTPSYPAAARDTINVARTSKEFLQKFNSLKTRDVILIGHSLGAQICGFTGQFLKNDLNYLVSNIIGLDPAGPLFTNEEFHCRLNNESAKIVQVIHTNNGLFGNCKQLGTIDFYPNCGSCQKGCDLFNYFLSDTQGIACSHLRVITYFIYSIYAILDKNIPKFYAQNCDCCNRFIRGSCCNNSIAIMGAEYDGKATGKYYLYTDKKIPYALGNVCLAGEPVAPICL